MLRCIHDLICIFTNINENRRKRGENRKKTPQLNKFQPSHHQINIVACFYIISDTKVFHPVGLLKLYHLHVHEYYFNETPKTREKHWIN